MEKPASSDVSLHDLIRRRWSPRAFADEPVPEESLRRVLEAARWAPSCFNDQPWSFLVARRDRPSRFKRMLECLVEGNRTWARRAPVLMFSVARTTFDHNGEQNAHARHDVGLAAENLVLQALDEGLFVHQMAGFHPGTVRENFGIPRGHEPVAGLALGYPGSPEDLPGELAERERAPRRRKSLEEFVFGERWGEPSEVVRETPS